MRRGVLLIGNYPPPYGGVPRVIENLAAFLAEGGWSVHVVSGGRTGVERRGEITIHKLPLGAKLPLLARHAAHLRGGPIGIRVRSAHDMAIRTWYQVLASVGREVLLRHRIDVICGFNLSRGGLIGTVLGRERGVPAVVNSFGELISDPAFFKANPSVLPFICGTAARLVSGSRHCASTFARFGLAPAVEVIPYGVDATRFEPTVSGSAMRDRLDARPSDVVVLFLGRHIPEMGLHTLLSAAPNLLARDAALRLVIAGASGELSAAAHALAARSGDRVRVLENVPYAELPALYAACDMLAAPTAGDRACSSLSAAEALATGRPVVAARVGGIPELVRDGENGVLVPAEDVPALTEAVLGLAKDPDGRRRLGEKGRAWIETEWDTRITLARMAAVLDETARAAA
ncbi:MAG TPA: glycosyltransferase family 4 protein [Gemmatimonadales bacterium]|nr:glycosyltransferase family 4 protein [Gemmatimonadales bacterium]